MSNEKMKLIIRILILASILPIISLVGLDASIELPTEYFMKEDTLLPCIVFGITLNMGVLICIYIISFISWAFDAYE
jgi:hypothetical protein